MDPVALLRPGKVKSYRLPPIPSLRSSSESVMYPYTIIIVLVALRVQFAWTSPISREAPIIGVEVPSNILPGALTYGMGDSEERAAPTTNAIVNLVVGTSTAALSSSTGVQSSAASDISATVTSLASTSSLNVALESGNRFMRLGNEATTTSTRGHVAAMGAAEVREAPA